MVMKIPSYSVTCLAASLVAVMLTATPTALAADIIVDATNDSAAAQIRWNKSLAWKKFPAAKGTRKRMVVSFPFTRCRYTKANAGTAEKAAIDNSLPYDTNLYDYLQRTCGLVEARGVHPDLTPVKSQNAFNSVVAISKKPFTDQERNAQAEQITMLVEEAFTNIDFEAPQVRTSPALDKPQIVNLPTWWHVTNANEETGSAEAGPIRVDITATPIRTAWIPGYQKGDAEPFAECNGVGIDYDDGMDENATDCKYTYRWPNGKEQATIEVDWNVHYIINSPLTGRDEGDLDVKPTLQNLVDLRVYERHALVTR